MGFFNYIAIPFGWLMRWCCQIFDSFGGYAVALLAFSIVVQVVLFPLGIKQQKNSQKQAKLRPKESAIRKKYAGRTDRETQMKMNEEIQKLYQEENFSPFSGCLPLLIQLPIIFALFYVIQQPLTFIANMTPDEIAVLRDIMMEESETFAGIIAGLTEKRALADVNVREYEIALVNAIHENWDAVKTLSFVKDEVIPNFSVFGNFLNLSEEPWDALKENVKTFKDFFIQLKVVIIPVLTFASSFFGQKLTRKFTYQSQTQAETEASMKLMNVMMPLFSAFLAFTWPAVMGLYWTYRSILSFVQQILLSKMFPIPVMTEKDLKEAEKAYAAKNKAKPYRASENVGRKSLIFDDDEPTENIPEAQNKSIVSETEEEEPKGESFIPKAPLK